MLKVECATLEPLILKDQKVRILFKDKVYKGIISKDNTFIPNKRLRKTIIIEDEPETKENSTLDDVWEDDITVNEIQEDKINIRSFEKRTFESKYQMYDEFGNAEKSNSKAMFVVLQESGIVLSIQYQGLIIVQYTKDSGAIRFAPCRLVSYKKEDDNLFGIFQFLKKFKEMKKNPAEASSNDFLLASTHIQPLDCVVEVSSQLSILTKEKYMPSYKGVLRPYENMNKPKLSWMPFNKHQDLHNVADVYDFLEFYHCRDERLWKTQLGNYIFETYVSKILFNNDPKHDLVNLVFASPKLTQESVSYHHKGDCDACGKKDVICKIVLCSSENPLYLGKVCAQRIAYLHKIAFLMNQFRSSSGFKLQNAIRFLNNVQSEFRSGLVS